MYRPTVRYEDEFREYVDALFRATRLDRNQIMRLALFLLGHTKEGRDVLTFFSTSPLPEPLWDKNNMVLWYGKACEFQFSEGERLEEGGGTPGDNQDCLPGYEGTAARSGDGQVYEETKSEPIIFRVGNTLLLPKRG